MLKIHFLQVGLLNVDGYYNNLLALFDNGVEEGFIKPGARHIVISAPTAEELVTKMEVSAPYLYVILLLSFRVCEANFWVSVVKNLQQYSPSHEHVAPHESWQMEELGNYTKQQNSH